jgi:7-cyano-7-deazaguanine synthase
MSEKVVVLVSGGLDSVTLLHHVVKGLGKKAFALNMFYGQRHENEIECAQDHCDDLDVLCDELDVTNLFRDMPSALIDTTIPVPHIKDVLGHPQPPTYVPNRNMIFLSIAVAYAEAHGCTAVYYGAQLHDQYGYWDTTSEFVERMNAVTELNRLHRIPIVAPFANNSKADNIRLGLHLGVDFAKTWSCYNPQPGNEDGPEYLACGVCPTCSERRKGFQIVGIEDPIAYVER